MTESHLQIVKNGTALEQRRTGTLPPPLRMLRDRAERHFSSRLKAVFEQVDDTFFDLADRSDNSRQQTLYFDAMRLIRFERKAIETAFQQTIGLAFDSLVNSECAEKRASNELKSAAFELADGEELEEIIALDTMVSRADEGNRQQLQLLASRLEALTDQAVPLKDNPLGPDAVCDAFFRATDGLDIGIRSKLVLLKLFERHVITPLDDLLLQSNQLLQELGVLPDLEQREGAETKSIRGGQGAGSRHPGDFLDRDSLQFQQKNYGRLVSQLNSVMSRHWQPDDDNSGKLPSLPEAPPADVIKAIDQLDSAGALSLCERLQAQLANGDQSMSLGKTEYGLVHLVDALFDQICVDSSFPPTLLPEMANLQIAIAKAALSDSGFFDKQRHPARRLFNEAMQAAQGYSEHEALSDDALYPYIQSAVQQLQRCACSPVRLTQALTELVALTEKQRRYAVTREQNLLEDEQASSHLNFSYSVVTQLLASQMVGHELHKVVVTFVEQAWSKVMFLGHLREGDAGASWQMTTTIFEQVISWVSPNTKKSPNETQELLASIRTKLADIALDPYQTEHLIRDLEQFLTQSKATCSSQAERVMVEQVYPAIPGEQQDIEAGSGVLPVAKTSETVEESYLHEVESMPAGSWVEFCRSPKDALRARYIGTSGPLHTHIFVDRDGLKLTASNSRQLAHLLKSNQMVIVDNTPLFDRALATVVENMRQQ